MVHKSKTAFLEPKMLLLCIFLVSCCLPGSMGDAAEEFQENLEDLVALANKEIFLPVPKGKFRCSHVPCQLEKAIEALKVSFKNNPATTYISRMEKNMDYITSTLKKTRRQPKNTRSCQTRDLSLQTVPEHFKKYFQKVNENCWES